MISENFLIDSEGAGVGCLFVQSSAGADFLLCALVTFVELPAEPSYTEAITLHLSWDAEFGGIFIDKTLTITDEVLAVPLCVPVSLIQGNTSGLSVYTGHSGSGFKYRLKLWSIDLGRPCNLTTFA